MRARRRSDGADRVALAGLVTALVTIASLGAGCGRREPWPTDAGERFAQAASAYREGDFAAAERIYAGLLEDGAWTGAVLFNQGDALFRLGRLPEARLAWERARRLMPTDRDLGENLELVTERLGLGREPPPSWPIRVGRRLVLALDPDGWTALALAAWVALHVAGCVVWLGPPRVRGRALVAAALLLAINALVWPVRHVAGELRDGAAAIALEPDVPVSSSPGDTLAATLFTLPAGELVGVEGTVPGWVHVSLPNGWHGWVPETELGRIDRTGPTGAGIHAPS